MAILQPLAAKSRTAASARSTPNSTMATSGAPGRSATLAKQGKPSMSPTRGFTGQIWPENPCLRR